MTGAQASVFKVDASGMETILYLFTGDSDGQFPMAGLIRDAEGNLYSTTNTGGAYGYGTVFKLDPNGAETVLHSFSTSDGGNPVAGVIRDEAGNLYGTTYQGGLVYKLDPSGNETILHYFLGPDGSGPWSGVIRDQAGNLYGTTVEGGAYGYGVVYKITPLVQESYFREHLSQNPREAYVHRSD